MKYRVNNIYPFILVFLFLNCSNSKEGFVFNIIGEEMILPQTDLMNRNRSFEEPLSKDLKILTFIDGDCSFCINELYLWKKLMKKWGTDKIGFVYMIQSNDKLIAFKNFDSLQIKLDYPYFHDKGNRIKIKNKIPEKKLHQTFLLDKKNLVILVGNPTKHIEIEKLYSREINKLLD